VEANEVLSYSFSESTGFEFSDLIFNPISCDLDTYLGTFYSTFNETYTITNNEIDLDKTITDINLDEYRVFRIAKCSDNSEITEYLVSEANDQITITIPSLNNIDIFVEYGLATYSLDRGYQRLDMNIYDSVRKLSKYKEGHEIVDLSIIPPSGTIDILEIPNDPANPLESNEPKVVIPLLHDNKTVLEFNHLSLLYNTRLNGTFYLDDCVLQDTSNLQSVLATFTFTTEDGEQYFDFVNIIPEEIVDNQIPFEISLQPIYATVGYTTLDVEIDFLSYGTEPKVMPYVIFDQFELTADDRILETVSKPRSAVSNIINSPNYIQIFTDRLTDAYDVVDNAWFTIAVEGFNGYGDLVRLYHDQNKDPQFESQEEAMYYFQCLEEDDRRLAESLGFHLDAYDLELPEYLEGEINLYAGKGAYTYGDVYVADQEFEMGWENDYRVDVASFNENAFNEGFDLADLPLTSDEPYVEGELYLHHRIDITESQNIITTGLPTGVEFAIEIPNSTDRIEFVDVSRVDNIAKPWDWCESWQGYSLTGEDFGTYNPDTASSYPSYFIKVSSMNYEVIENSEGNSQINFFIPVAQVISALASDIIQIDFHIDHVFDSTDYSIHEEGTDFRSELHWQFPQGIYTDWRLFPYHPDMTDEAWFNVSYYHLSQYAPLENYKGTVVEEFQFYPNEYNFTTFEFTGFTDYVYSVQLNISQGSDCEDRWEDVKPFGMLIQTEEGERYLDENYFATWAYIPDSDGIFSVKLSRYAFRDITILEDSEVQVTYYYPKKSLSYYAEHDDILYDEDTFIIRDHLDQIVDHTGLIELIQGNNITFTEDIVTQLEIGNTFSVEMEVKTRGGLLETKHVFAEVQPWEMIFYNNYYPFSASSIIAPLYYNLSANYQYQMALNYRLIENTALTMEYELETSQNSYEIPIDNNEPLLLDDGEPVVFMYSMTESKREYIPEKYFSYATSIVTFDYAGLCADPDHSEASDIDKVYVEVGAQHHSKYLYYHEADVDLLTGEMVMHHWEVKEDAPNTLFADISAPYFLQDTDPSQQWNEGALNRMYAYLNGTNELYYYLSDELSDPNGWQGYDTLIMNLGFYNAEVLDNITVEFYYMNGATPTLIADTYIRVDMLEGEHGSVYLELPESNDWDLFTQANGAYMVLRPEFYDENDFMAYYYDQGVPTYQTVEWVEEDLDNGYLPVDLEQLVFDESIFDQQILIFNHEFEVIETHTTIYSRNETTTENGIEQEYEVHYILLPSNYEDLAGNRVDPHDGDIIFIKYNATIEKAIGLSVGEMVLQRAAYIENYRRGEVGEPDYVPLAEVALLGIRADGVEYSLEEDLVDHRSEMVAWEDTLDLTPFENEYFDTYHQKIYNISFNDINSVFKVAGGEGTDHCYITDILLTSNDPRYHVVVDSFFIFEFDESATLYDSEIYDIFAHNNMEQLYYGNYEDIYAETLIFDSTGKLPIYYDDPLVEEAEYFDAFDSSGNNFYFGEHLISTEISQGIYEITWNPEYNDQYYQWYYDAETEASELQELFEYYYPHIQPNRYLTLTWANETAWNEWRTISQPNVNASTVEVSFEWYEESSEQYESVIYNQSLTEFETRHFAVETLYPYNIDSNSGCFELSQDYSDAIGLDIFSITGYYYNQSKYHFDLGSCYIPSGEETIVIEAEMGITLKNFETIVVLLTFSSGVESDYSQFRLLQNAIDNHPTLPSWTANDSLYVDFD
jgi:hypothetical protein